MPFPHVIDNTMRSEFVKCPMAWNRRFNQHLDHPEESIHLVAGGAFARGLEVYRKTYYGGERDFQTAYLAGAQALCKEYGAFDAGSEAKSLYGMLRAYDFYLHEAFPPASDRVSPLITGGKPAVEFSFAIPLPINHPDSGDPLLYGGRFDMVGEYMNSLWCVDEKTTGAMGPQWMNQWSLRSQFTGYCWAAQQYGYHVAGVLIRGICILKEDLKQGEVIDYRPRWMIDRWYAQLLRDINRMIEAYKSDEYDMNLSDGCNAFGGCDYKILCLSRDPEPFIKTHFVEREWIPVAAG